MKWVKRTAWALALVLLMGVVVAVWLWHRGIPRTEGELKLSGLSASVVVQRDASDVTHILAQTPLDAWRALGHAHAQERGWQLEFNRRLMHGELSELLGPSTLEIDKLMRTLGIVRTAQAQYERLSDTTKAALTAYSEGIVLAHAQGQAGQTPEFLILSATPSGNRPAWTPQDSVAWGLMMALDLGGNWGNEMARLALSRRLNAQQLWTLMPPYPGDAPGSDVDFQSLYQGLGVYPSQNAAAAEVGTPQGTKPLALAASSEPSWASQWVRELGVLDGKGSNNWVVPGSRTESAKPLLANDPHLGLSAPAIWYFAHLQAKGQDGKTTLDVMGATLPGMPFVILGRTRGVAWGFTNTGPDVQDLYLEAVDPKRAGMYKTPTGWSPFETREESIRVKGQPDQRITVRSTRHGPVISDVQSGFEGLVDPARYVVALRWAALDTDNLSIEAGRLANEAQTVPELIKAFGFHHSPMQNVVMADANGATAFQTVGRVPIRAPGNRIRGLAPSPGWDTTYDWVGWIPYAENPALGTDAIESRGWHATANQKITPSAYTHWITSDWTTPERMNRIAELLSAQAKHSVASMQAVQNDVLSLGARALLVHARAAKPKHALGPQVMAMLAQFDGHMGTDSAAAALFNVWSDELTRAILMPALGEKTFSQVFGKRHFRAGVLQVMNHPDAFWCPNADCVAVSSLAMDKAIERMVEFQGKDPLAWRWGELHRAISSHRPFAKVWPLGPVFNVSVPSAGDLFTVNVGSYWSHEPASPFANRHAASMRAVYDLSEQGTNWFIYQTGQSGHPGSSHYRDMAQEWASGRYRELSFHPVGVSRKLVLSPS